MTSETALFSLRAPSSHCHHCSGTGLRQQKECYPCQGKGYMTSSDRVKYAKRKALREKRGRNDNHDH